MFQRSWKLAIFPSMVSDLWQRFWYMALFAGLWGTPFSDLNLYWNDLIHVDTPLNPLVHSQFPYKNMCFNPTLRPKTSIFQILPGTPGDPRGPQGDPRAPRSPVQRHPKWPWPPGWSVERHRSASRPGRGWNSAAPREKNRRHLGGTLLWNR